MPVPVPAVLELSAAHGLRLHLTENPGRDGDAHPAPRFWQLWDIGKKILFRGEK